MLKLHLAIKNKIAECRNYQWERQKKRYEWKYKGGKDNYEAAINEQIELSKEREKAFLEILQIIEKL